MNQPRAAATDLELPAPHRNRSRWRWWLFAGLLACVALYGTVAWLTRIDPYLDRALHRIETSLHAIPDSYGIEVNEVLWMRTLSNSGEVREDYGLYVSGSRVQFRHEKYPIQGDASRPYLTYVTLDPGDNTGTSRAERFRGKDGVDRYRMVSMPTSPSFAIGQMDPYEHFRDPLARRDHPEKSPWQILTNPCFAPLKMQPDQIRRWSIQALPDQDGMKVYEATGRRSEGWLDSWTWRTSVRMFFSPRHGDLLARTEVRIRELGSKTSMLMEVRSVDKWQQMSDGTFVPFQFTCQRMLPSGAVDWKAFQTITVADPGPFDPAKFDRRQIPEYRDQHADVRE